MAKKEIKKHNSITDALTNYSLPAEKLLNAIYYTWQEVGENSFDVPIVDLKKLIGMKSDGNTEFIIEALQELRTTQSFRNFSYGGRDVKYHAGSFLSSLTIYKDNINYVKINIDPLIVSALQQRAGYTPLDLDVANFFRTSYGYKLYQFYRRYRTLPNEGGVIKKSFSDLNDHFGTKYKTVSELSRCIDRGIAEIKKITGEIIIVEVNRKEKIFEFSWELTKKVEEFKTFKRWFLSSFKGYPDPIIDNSENDILIGLNENGYFFHFVEKSKKITKEESEEYWQILFDQKDIWIEKHKKYSEWKARKNTPKKHTLF